MRRFRGVGPGGMEVAAELGCDATGDKAAGSDVLVSMAHRAGAEITMLKGSHVIMISKPKRVADVIIDAAETTRRHSWTLPRAPGRGPSE
ncbi:hypothetical protein ACVBEQ_07310 [Nakamurella sp. GG22]